MKTRAGLSYDRWCNPDMADSREVQSTVIVLVLCDWVSITSMVSIEDVKMLGYM